jgi:hypothetical protein
VKEVLVLVLEWTMPLEVCEDVVEASHADRPPVSVLVFVLTMTMVMMTMAVEGEELVVASGYFYSKER